MLGQSGWIWCVRHKEQKSSRDGLTDSTWGWFLFFFFFNSLVRHICTRLPAVARRNGAVCEQPSVEAWRNKRASFTMQIPNITKRKHPDCVPKKCSCYQSCLRLPSSATRGQCFIRNRPVKKTADQDQGSNLTKNWGLGGFVGWNAEYFSVFCILSACLYPGCCLLKDSWSSKSWMLSSGDW